MRKGILYIVLLASLITAAQTPLMLGGGDEIQPASLNFLSIPNLGGTEITNYGANLTFGFPVKKSIVGFSLAYQNFDFSFSESTNTIDLSSFENMQVLRGNVSLIKPLKNSFSFMLSAGTSLMSNFDNGISSEDFVFNAIVGVVKKWGDDERNSTLLIGAFYGTQLGEPTLLPALSFSQKLNEHWSYSLGLPVTGVNYRINENHRFALLASPQGIFGNNSTEVRVDGNRSITNTKLQFNGINTRISYQFRFTKHLAFFAEGGFIPISTLKILDNDNNEIIDLDPGSGTYVNAGIRFVLSRSKKNNHLKSKSDEN